MIHPLLYMPSGYVEWLRLRILQGGWYLSFKPSCRLSLGPNYISRTNACNRSPMAIFFATKHHGKEVIWSRDVRACIILLAASPLHPSHFSLCSFPSAGFARANVQSEGRGVEKPKGGAWHFLSSSLLPVVSSFQVIPPQSRFSQHS